VIHKLVGASHQNQASVHRALKLPDPRAQSDAALFRRLCPADKAGKMAFAPVMLKRLRKLGIDKTNPADLTEEERSRSVCSSTGLSVGFVLAGAHKN